VIGLPSPPTVSDPPDLPPSLTEGEDDDVREWVVSRFEKIGYAYPWALELAVGRVDHHDMRRLIELMGEAGYDDATAREMAAEILL
jgi:hypothetical protein